MLKFYANLYSLSISIKMNTHKESGLRFNKISLNMFLKRKATFRLPLHRITAINQLHPISTFEEGSLFENTSPEGTLSGLYLLN
ncbi:MAG: hypothetical protein IPJ13_01285 [Saprospiraceae bacterium]|nr:hypothetical protein [Saprospiraceae bacterium]